jgi:hypothetical protein
MFKMVWGEDQMPIYICVWHILKFWHLHLMENVKNNGVQHAIFDDLYTIMYTSPIYKLHGFVPNSNLLFHKFVLVKHECCALFKHESHVYNFHV